MIRQAKVPPDGKDAPVVAFWGAASPLTDANAGQPDVDGAVALEVGDLLAVTQ